MILIPSLHLMGGKVVRLRDGKPETMEVVGENPVGIARDFTRQGALFFQLIDLDAVFGTGDNLAVLDAFADAAIPCQFGGGVRSPGRAEQVLQRGADRVLLGTLFHESPDEARAVVERFGLRVLGALDAEGGRLRTRGWAGDAETVVDEALDELIAAGVQAVVYTEVRRGFAKDEPPDFDAIARMADRSRDCGLALTVDAGIRGVDDLERLASIDGLGGALLGHGVYAESLDLAELLVAV